MKQNSKSAWIISLGAGVSQVPLIKAATALGYRVLAIDKNPDSVGFRFATESLVHSVHDGDFLITKLRSRSFDGLLCRCSGAALFTAAKLNEFFGFPGINSKLAEISTSKSALREFCVAKNLQMPHGVRSDARDLNELAREFDRNVVVKPDFTLVGKQSIKKIDLEDMQGLQCAIEAAAASSGNGLVEVEQFIDGYDCSVLFWMSGGELTPIFNWDELTVFDDDGDVTSAGVAAPSLAASRGHLGGVIAASTQLAASFCSVSALVAFSFRVDPLGNCWLLEIHSDFTGDLILDVLAPETTGYAYLDLLTRTAIDGFIASETKKVLLNQSFTPTAVIYATSTSYDVLKAESINALHTTVESVLRRKTESGRYTGEPQ